VSVIDRILKRISELYAPGLEEKLQSLETDIERLSQVQRNLSAQLESHRSRVYAFQNVARQASEVITALSTLSGTHGDPEVIKTLQNLQDSRDRECRSVIEVRACDISPSLSAQDTEDAVFFRYFFGEHKDAEVTDSYINQCKTCTSLGEWRAWFRSVLVASNSH